MMLDSGMTDSQIGNMWINTWHASHEPSKDGLSYRGWLIATLNALEADVRSRWLVVSRKVVGGQLQGLRCPENQDGDLEVTWAAFPTRQEANTGCAARMRRAQ